MTRLKALTPRWLQVILILLPLLLASLYYALVASDRYVSESMVVLRDANAQIPSMAGAVSLMAALPNSPQLDTLVLREYIQSAGLATKLDQSLGIRQHFGGGGIDPLSHLSTSASLEDFVDFYRSRVEVIFDDRSQALKVRTQGLDATYAQALNRDVLEQSERFVNEASHKIARERLAFAEGEMSRAAERLQTAQGTLLGFQTTHRLIDPTAEVAAASAVNAELTASITKTETELRALRSYLQDDASQIVALRAQLAALRAQLDAERTRATARSSNDKRIAALAIEFQGLKLQFQVAEDAYKGSLAAVEGARLDATRKISSLVVVEPPTLPETALYPRRLYGIATVLVCSLLLYTVVRLAVATIREHQD